MVIARIRGGLGNQLFIYAVARRLSLKNKVSLKLDTISGFKWDYYKRKYMLNHFNINAGIATSWESCTSLIGRIRRYYMKRLNSYMQFENRYYITEDILGFDERVMNIKINRRTYIEGYWQSEKYFKDIEDIIRKDLEIKSAFSTTAKNEAKMILEKNSVCVGIRRFEEEHNKNNYNRPILSINYYLKAIDIMAQKVPDCHFFVFSQEPEWIKRNLKSTYPFTLITHKEGNERAYEDLWLMSLCKHFIISQSTYHWWGAWLSKNIEKIVIAPDPDYIKIEKDYIPQDWIKFKI